MEKKSAKKYIFGVLAVLLAAALVIIPFALESAKDASGDKASILSAEAALGDISKTVSGAGTLTDEDAVEIKLPYGVEVTKYLVNNGDFVTEGQPLAEVDRIDVMNSIYEYQEDIEYVETQMALYTDTGEMNFLTTASAGRVMELYADVGDSISDVMLEHGALAVLSLDGLLAVDIETDVIPVGSSVGVAAPDGTILSGHAESKKNGVTVITINQDGRAVGESVSVFNENSETIGNGELYVHSPLKISGYNGTIEAVHVKINQDMQAGGTVFTYSGNSSSAEYDVYAAKHTELAGYMEELFRMYTDGTVNASAAGVVSGIDEDAAAELLAASGDGSAALDFLVNRGTGFDAVKTAVVTEDNVYPYYKCAVVVGLTLKEDGTGVMTYRLTTNKYDNPTEAVLAAKNLEIEGVTHDLELNGENLDTRKLSIGTVILFSYAQGAPEIPTIVDGSGASAGGQTVSGGAGGASASGMTGSTTQQAAYEYYPTKQTKIMSVTPQDTMTVDITVDELDILSIKKGQDVQITLDALAGQSFDGVITDIGVSGSNSGGNTKYTAEVTIDRAPNMIAGMNATALITLETDEDLLTVPSEALVSEGTRTYVYTSYDSKDGALGNPVDVTTGASDGILTEITSGLKAGDTVWYSYYDKPDNDFSFGADMPQPPEMN